MGEKIEIALMTLAEYLKFLNPRGKEHPADSYDKDEDSLFSSENEHFSRNTHVSNDGRYVVRMYDHGFILERDSKPILLFSDNQGYMLGSISPRSFNDMRFPYTEWEDVKKINDAIKNSKPVKYLDKQIKEFLSKKKRNLEKYKHIINTFMIGSKTFQLRSKEKPIEDYGETIVVMEMDGTIVGFAADEWGASLVSVNRKYRGFGFGIMLGEHWYQNNPSYKSGGFTIHGKRSATARWKEAVRRFLANGEYSKRTLSGELTKERVKLILKDLDKKKQVNEREKEADKSKEIVIHLDEDMYSVTIYDKKFIEDRSEKNIYAFGFLRYPEPVGAILFSIDYEEGFGELILLIALEILLKSNEKMYVGKVYRDYFDDKLIDDLNKMYNNIIIKEDDYIYLKESVVDVNLLPHLEKKILKGIFAKRHEKSEFFDTLAELAEAKWK